MTYYIALKKIFVLPIHRELRLLTFQLINILYITVVLCHILTGFLEGDQYFHNKNCFFDKIPRN